MTINEGNQQLVANPVPFTRILHMPTNHLVPDIVEEEAEDQEYGSEPYVVDHAKYISRELVGSHADEPETHYYCYSIELQLDFQYDVKPQGILLAVRERLDSDLKNLNLDLEADRGKVIVSVKDVGYVTMSPKKVVLCQKFQVTLFQILLRHKLHEGDENFERNGSILFNYLLLPSLCSHGQKSIDWKCIESVSFAKGFSSNIHTDLCSSRGARRVRTKNGLVCNCALENALVCTPHNRYIYCIKDTLDGIDGNSNFTLRDGESITYKNYYHRSHGINLQFEWQTLLYGKHVFTVHNFLHRCRTASTREQSKNSCELPPELCSIIMSPISISAIYSFSFLPSIMHRIESLLLASNLRSVPLVHSTQNVTIPTIKVLEAITSKKCQETLHLESLETLGDSFLKYAASQQLFKTYENGHEGLLSRERERIISNAALCRLGCDCKIPGFIRNEPFDPKTWIIPGSASAHLLEEEQLSPSKIIYIVGSSKMKIKKIADVVEALIGAFLSAGGEIAALSFMSWLGINVDLANVPCKRTSIVNPDKYVNVLSIESLLKYKFQDTSLLVEALTHGSYMRPEVPVCYQRLEFLGDAVLDYLITLHLYHKYLVLSPGLLTNLRSASVNNDCYAQSAIKAGLHKHILHFSPDLHRHMCQILSEVEESQLLMTFGWESETEFPDVLGDVIESLAGAIYIDSGGDKERVFQSMRPLLEPLVTLETLRLQPKRELDELCKKMHYGVKKPVVSRENGVSYVTVEVEADGFVHRATRSARNKKMAERLACKDVLKSVKKPTSSVLD